MIHEQPTSTPASAVTARHTPARDTTIPPYRSERPVYAMIFLTRRCNLDCGYCHMAHTGVPDPDEAALARGVDLFMRSIDNVCFHIFGGEPLLRFDLIEWLVDYVATHYPDRGVKYLITTNGMLLKDRTVEWLVQRDIELMLSLDGTWESQAGWRTAVNGQNRRAYDVVVDHIRGLTARGVPHFVNMCVSPNNVDRMDENVAHIKALGARRLQIAYELGGMWEKDDRRGFLDGLRGVIERHHEEGVFDIMNAPDAEPVLGNMTFVLDTNGDIYRGCSIVLEHHMPTFNRSTYCGRVEELESVAPFFRSRLAQVTAFLRYTRRDPRDWKILRSNYHLGYQVRRMLTRMGHRVWGVSE